MRPPCRIGKSGRLTLAGMALALFATACSGTASDDEERTAEGPAPDEIVIGIRTDVDTFDAHRTLAEFGASQMLRLAYGSLVMRDGDGELVPQIAEEWEVVSPSESVFTIRQGVTCPDGQELSASDVATSFERLADPETASPFAVRIFGGEPATFDADDAARTLTITLGKPNADIVAALANVGPVVCPEGLKDPERLASEPNGPGPYEMVSAQRGDKYVFKLREDYTALPEGTELGDMPKQITLRVVGDDSAMANGILTKEITAGIVLGRDGERLERPEVQVLEAPGYGGDGLVFNHASGLPGADESFRKAIAVALDPALYNRAATFDRGRILRTVVTPNMECYSEDNEGILEPVSIDDAASALDDAGYEVVDGTRVTPAGKPLKVRVIGHTGQNDGPAYIADVLDQLQIDNDLQRLSYDRAINAVFSGEFDLFVWPYTGSLGTPLQLVGELSGDLSNSINASGITNTVYDTNASKAREALDGGCELWAEGERSLLEKADVVPLVWPVSYHYSNDITFTASYYSIDPFSIRGLS